MLMFKTVSLSIYCNRNIRVIIIIITVMMKLVCILCLSQSSGSLLVVGCNASSRF